MFQRDACRGSYSLIKSDFCPETEKLQESARKHDQEQRQIVTPCACIKGQGGRTRYEIVIICTITSKDKAIQNGERGQLGTKGKNKMK